MEDSKKEISLDQFNEERRTLSSPSVPENEKRTTGQTLLPECETVSAQPPPDINAEPRWSQIQTEERNRQHQLIGINQLLGLEMTHENYVFKWT
jgi:hypothetical protein